MNESNSSDNRCLNCGNRLVFSADGRFRQAVTPAIEAFLRQEVKEEKEREARTRRGAKAVTYGSYNLKDLIDKLQAMLRVAVTGNQLSSKDF